MKIAITGGTGFVGRNLARALAAEGHEGVLLEDLRCCHNHARFRHQVFFETL